MTRDGRPVDPETRARIVALMEEGLGRNEIAREVGLGGATVSKVAGEVGHTFDRTQTAVAVAARGIDIAARRLELAAMALVEAERALDDMRAPTTIVQYSAGGEFERGGWKEHTLDEPTFSDRRNLATVFGILVSKSAELTRPLEGAGAAEGASVLGALADIFREASDRLGDVDPTRGPEEDG